MKTDFENHGIDKHLVTPTGGFRVTRERAGLKIEKRWFCRKSWFYIGFALFANGFFILVLKAMSISDKPVTGFKYFLVIGSLGLPALGLIYLALRDVLNKTTIFIRQDQIIYSTSPFGKMKQVRTELVSNVSIERNVMGEFNERPIFSYFLYIHLKTDVRERICPARDLNQALYLEKMIEEFLHLEDLPLLDKVVSNDP